MTNDIANDPTLVQLDAFAQEHRQAAGLDLPRDDETVSLICANHAQISSGVLVVDETEAADESSKKDAAESLQMKQLNFEHQNPKRPKRKSSKKSPASAATIQQLMSRQQTRFKR